MKLFMKITLASILALFGIGCAKQDESKVEKVNLSELKKGPIQREKLSNEQLSRIEKIRKDLVEIDRQSKEEWIDNFKRDLDPDKEIASWEQIAKVYKTYCSKNELSIGAKEEVFQIILLRSMAMSKEEVLKQLELKILTEREAKNVMELY